MTDPAASALKFDHAQVTGRFYYALPKQLVNLLEAVLGSSTFDPAAWDLERRLAAETDRHWNRVGYRDGFPLDYPYLFEPAGIEIPNDVRTAWGRSTGQAATLIATWAGAAPRFRGPTVGYCGWLLTNPDFLAEHDALLDRWLGHLFHHPIPGPADIRRLVLRANGRGDRPAPGCGRPPPPCRRRNWCGRRASPSTCWPGLTRATCLSTRAADAAGVTSAAKYWRRSDASRTT
jgi:hypothetical protein